MARNLPSSSAMRSLVGLLAVIAPLTCACQSVEYYRVREADLPPAGPLADPCWVPAVRANEPGRRVRIDARTIESRSVPGEGSDLLVRSMAWNDRLSSGSPLTVWGSLLTLVGSGLIASAAAAREDYERNCHSDCFGFAGQTLVGTNILASGLVHLLVGLPLTVRGTTRRPQEPGGNAHFPEHPCVHSGRPVPAR